MIYGWGLCFDSNLLRGVWNSDYGTQELPFKNRPTGLSMCSDRVPVSNANMKLVMWSGLAVRVGSSRIKDRKGSGLVPDMLRPQSLLHMPCRQRFCISSVFPSRRRDISLVLVKVVGVVIRNSSGLELDIVRYLFLLFS